LQRWYKIRSARNFMIYQRLTKDALDRWAEEVGDISSVRSRFPWEIQITDFHSRMTTSSLQGKRAFRPSISRARHRNPLESIHFRQQRSSPECLVSKLCPAFLRISAQRLQRSWDLFHRGLQQLGLWKNATCGERTHHFLRHTPVYSTGYGLGIELEEHLRKFAHLRYQIYLL
jgi:hypothetical protein